MNTTSVRRAIYGKLSGDTTLNNLLGAPGSGHAKAIYFEEAPAKAAFPYVIFNKQAGTPSYAFTTVAAYKADVWLVKGVDKSTSADGAEAVQARLEDLLTSAVLSISGETLLYLRPDSDVNYAEKTAGVLYQHAGALYRLIHSAP